MIAAPPPMALALSTPATVTAVLAVAGLIVASAAFVAMSRYRRCPRNALLVVYGHTREGSSRILHPGDTAFIWPVIQDFAYLSLDPIDVPDAQWRTGEPIRCTVRVGREPTMEWTATQRLLGMDEQQIVTIVRESVRMIGARTQDPAKRDAALGEHLREQFGLELVGVKAG